MRIAELSQRSGVPIATIKYYLREELLIPGRAVSANQADYDDTHLARLRLVRALVSVGRLRVRQVVEVLAAVEDESIDLHDALGLAQDAMVTTTRSGQPDHERARVEVDRLLANLGWRVRPEAAVRDLLADAVVMIWGSGGSIPEHHILAMAADALEVAGLEIASLDPTSRERAVEASVTGTIAYEVAANALRRMALEHHSALRFAPAKAARRAASRQPVTRRAAKPTTTHARD